MNLKRTGTRPSSPSPSAPSFSSTLRPASTSTRSNAALTALYCALVFRVVRRSSHVYMHMHMRYVREARDSVRDERASVKYGVTLLDIGPHT